MTEPEAPAVITRGEQNVTFPVANSEDGIGYLSGHSKDSVSGVVVIQEWWGMNQSIQKTADRIAQQGFRTLVPDLYRGKVAKDHEEAGHLLQGLNWGQAVADIAGAVQYLKNNGCKKVGVVGFCMGGALVIASAANVKELDAGVCFYGIPDLKSLPLNNIKIPLQAHFGNDDTYVGFSDKTAVNNLESTFKEHNIPIEIFRYEGVGHAFTNVDRKLYNEKVASEAWATVFAFFHKNLSA